ncbi:hypothetical protein Tco_0138420 [Tanacetum coccineum]
MDQDSTHMVAASKVPMLKPGEYKIWRMRIEQYIQLIDYALWEVIENGATLPKITTVEGVVTVMPITTAEEKAMKWVWQGPHMISEVHEKELYKIIDASDHSLIQTAKGTSLHMGLTTEALAGGDIGLEPGTEDGVAFGEEATRA